MEPYISFSFTAINLIIMPLWFLLLVFPGSPWTRIGIDLFVVCAATMYSMILLPDVKEVFPIIVRPTLESVGPMLATPSGTLAGWTHFVIADLWAGRWISQDGAAHGISRYYIVPLLVLTLLFGPMGLVGYFLLKLALKKKFGTESTSFSIR